MAFNGRGVPQDELLIALADYAATWDGVLAPSGAELAAWVARAFDDQRFDTLAVGNRARREFVRLYGEGSRRRPRTPARDVVDDQPLRATARTSAQVSTHRPDVATDASCPNVQDIRTPSPDLPDVERWDDPRKPAPWRVDEPPAPEDDEAEMIARWQQDHERDRTRWHREVGPRVFERDERLPIGLTLFGDQHVDDDGCDVRELVRTVRTVAGTEGLYGVNLGDVTNNWTGKLAHLWAHQSTTHDEAARRASWLMRSLPWLCVVSGNHDDWNDSTLRLAMVERKPLHYARIEARMEFRIGGQAPIRVIARHQFKGSSMWHPHHGLKREAVMGDRWGDVYAQGHHHDSHVATEELQDGRRVWMVKARGFKHYDSYAHRLQFHDHRHGHAPTLILDPWSPPADRVRVVFDVEEAAAMLAWLRERRGRRAV